MNFRSIVVQGAVPLVDDQHTFYAVFLLINGRLFTLVTCMNGIDGVVLAAFSFCI